MHINARLVSVSLLAALAGHPGMALAQPGQSETTPPPTGTPSVQGPAKPQGPVTELGLAKKPVAVVPEVDGWYNTLANDHASVSDWVEAANDITRGGDVENIPGGELYADFRAFPTLPPGVRLTLSGEPLRKKAHPSVTELLARRALQLARIPPVGPLGMANIEAADYMARQLREWDPNHSVPCLQAVTRQAWNDVGNSAKNGGSGAALAAIAHLTIARHGAGDATALLEYAAMIERHHAADFADSDIVMEPLWRYPADPDMIRASRRIFEDKTWGWQAYVDDSLYNGGGYITATGLITTPLIGVRAFRQFVIRALRDRRVIGKVIKKKAGGEMELVYEAGKGTGSTFDSVKGDANEMRVGTLPHRVCDEFAGSVSTLEGAPDYEFTWKLTARNRAIRKDNMFLEHYGNQFRYNPNLKWVAMGDPWTHARLSFPSLHRPATRADVLAGQAIFTLGAGARPVQGIRLPQRATWLGYQGPRDDSGSGLDLGIIWQAEEIRIQGHWRRFYGFVGQHMVSKLPGSEVEFRAPDLGIGWSELGHGLDARLELDEEGQPIQVDLTSLAVVGESSSIQVPSNVRGPFPVTIWLRNRLGVARQVPLNLVRSNPTALRRGIRISMSYFPPGIDYTDPNAKFKIQVLKPKTNATFPPEMATRALETNARITTGTFDLRNFFDFTRPGTYSVGITFDPSAGLPAGNVGSDEIQVMAPGDKAAGIPLNGATAGEK